MSTANDLRPQFNGTFNLGQLAVCLTVFAGMLATYYTGAADLRKEIAASIQMGVTNKQRLDILDVAITQIREEQRLSQAETRQKLDRIIEQISDVRERVPRIGTAPTR